MMNKLSFLTKVSLKKKIATKWFFIANIFIFFVIVGLVNIDSVIKIFGGDFNEETNILVIDNTNNYYDEFEDNLKNYNNYLDKDSNISIKKYDKDLKKIKKELKEDDNKVAVIIDSDENNYIKAEIISYEGIDTIVYQAMTLSINDVRRQIVLDNYNITDEMQMNIEKSVEITRTRLDEGKEDEEITELLSGIVVPLIMMPFFMLIIFLVQMIGAEINEEKMTKSMEIIISNVSPKIHFMSKLLAGNIFVLIQGLIIIFSAGVGIIVRYFVNSGSLIGEFSSEIGEISNLLSSNGLMDKIYVVLPVAGVLLVLTFIGYSLLAGILASMTTNADDFQQLQTPIIVVSLIGFYLSLLSFMFEGSMFIKIVSYIPLISSLLVPSLLVMGQLGVIDIIISVLLMIVFDYLLIKYGLRIYKVGILNYSSNDLWKKMFKAIKDK